MERMLQRLNFDIKDLSLNELTDRAEYAYEMRGTDIMQFEKYNIFDVMKDDIAAIRDQALKNADLVRYCYFLSEIIREDNHALISHFSSPLKERKDEVYDLLPLFALLDHIPQMISNLREQNVPESIIADTCEMFQNQVGDFLKLNHRFGVSDYVSWLCLFLRCKIIRVGRFNLEMTTYREPFEILTNGKSCVALPNQVIFHQSGNVLGSIGCENADNSFEATFVESDCYFRGLAIENALCKPQAVQYDKKEWKHIITYGTPIISIHIPSGGSLYPDVCEQDLARGKEIINQCFGEYRHLFCKSWLLDPQLGEMLDRRGNLHAFAKRFLRFPIKSNGMGVFEYVFACAPNTPLESLPENTTLAKSIKRHLLSGGHIHGACGIIMDTER